MFTRLDAFRIADERCHLQIASRPLLEQQLSGRTTCAKYDSFHKQLHMLDALYLWTLTRPSVLPAVQETPSGQPVSVSRHLQVKTTPIGLPLETPLHVLNQEATLSKKYCSSSWMHRNPPRR